MTALVLALHVLLGDPFPKVELATLSGPAVELPPPGRALVALVFATWCGSCHEALPILERLRARFGDRVDFVTIAEDDDEGGDGGGGDVRQRVARMAKETGLSMPILLDTDHALYRRLGIHKLPTAYIVDAAGIVRHKDNGFGPGYEARLTGWIDGLFGGGHHRPL